MVTLRPYQLSGSEALAARRKLYLGDEPGLGKTRTILHAAQAIGARRIGVVCPAIVRPHWHREAADLGMRLYFAASYEHIVAHGMPGSALPDVFVPDEAHFCKHRNSKRTRAIFGTGGIAHQVLDAGGRVWPLSGTPMPRNPSELYAVMASLWPKTLANRGLNTYFGWLNRYCRWRATRYGIKVYGIQNAEELRELLGMVMVRRLVRDVAPDLPPLRWGLVDIDVPQLAEVLLAEADIDPRTRAALEAGEIPPMDAQLARYRHQIGDLKAPVVAELVRDELDAEPETSKKVLFAYHRSVLDILENALSLYGAVRIDGDTSPRMRELLRDRFEGMPTCRVFLGQIGACAVGLDGLQHVAPDAIMVEPDWRTDFNVQAAKRLARLGQTLPVQCRMVSLANTLDYYIVRNHERETGMVADVTG